MYDIVELNGKLVADLRQIAKEFDIPKPDKLLKKELIYKILDHQALNPTKDVLEAEKRNQVKKGRQRVPSTKNKKEPNWLFYFAISCALVSLITVTLIVPG